MTVPPTMPAWRVHSYGDPLDALTLDDVTVPTPGPGELLVEVEGIPLNLNDLERVTGGAMMVRPELPYSPGMEVVGTIVAAGAGAEAHVGRRVAAATATAIGGYARYAVAPAAAAFDMPDDIAMPDAAALFFPFHLAWLALHDRAELRAGETVLVHAAAGGAGSAAVQLAKDAGAVVIATASTDEKLRVAAALGADVTLNTATVDDLAAAVLEHTGGRGADVVMDSVGAAVWEPSWKALAYGGRYVMTGFASDKSVADEPFVVPRAFMLANARLCGVMLAYQSAELAALIKGATGWNMPTTDVGERIQREIVDRYRAGRIHAVVGEVVPFAELPRALDALANRATTGRIVVTP